MKSFLLICALFFSQLTMAQSNGHDLTDALTLVDVWLEAQQVYEKLPGISAGIVSDQELVWSKGYGVSDLKKKIPASPQTVYSICSISKLFTAIAVMQLYEKGKLRLDDSLSMHLPGFNVSQQFRETEPITIRSLLTHSSGLPREADFPYWTAPDFSFPSEAQVSEKLSQQKTLFPSSAYFHYSNLGMALLGQVVEKVSGMPYDTYVEENILKPLRLSNTHPYLPAASWGTKMATGYSSKKRDGTRDVVPLFDAKGIRAAVGFSSSVEDLAHFASWQFRLIGNGGREILKAVTLKEMHRVHWVDPDWKIHWGLGFVVYQQHGKTIVGHAGTCPGYRTTLLIEAEEKLAFIVMMNANENPGRYASQIRHIINKAMRTRPATSSGVDLSQYTGLYNAQPLASETRVLSWYGKLAMIELPTDNPVDDVTFLQHVEGDVFRKIRNDDSLGEQITFERGPGGKVIRLWNHSNASMKLN